MQTGPEAKNSENKSLTNHVDRTSDWSKRLPTIIGREKSTVNLQQSPGILKRASIFEDKTTISALTSHTPSISDQKSPTKTEAKLNLSKTTDRSKEMLVGKSSTIESKSTTFKVQPNIRVEPVEVEPTQIQTPIKNFDTNQENFISTSMQTNINQEQKNACNEISQLKDEELKKEEPALLNGLTQKLNHSDQNVGGKTSATLIVSYSEVILYVY
jgi:predicted metal-dependent hydrolase